MLTNRYRSDKSIKTQFSVMNINLTIYLNCVLLFRIEFYVKPSSSENAYSENEIE